MGYPGNDCHHDNGGLHHNLLKDAPIHPPLLFHRPVKPISPPRQAVLQSHNSLSHGRERAPKPKTSETAVAFRVQFEGANEPEACPCALLPDVLMA